MWKLTHLGQATVTGRVLVRGDFARLSHPDNIRFTPAGDLLILEDNGGDLEAEPATRGLNQLYMLPAGSMGAGNLLHFGRTMDEPTGPWFSADGELLYLSLQGNPSRVLVIHGRQGFDEPYGGWNP